MPFLSGAEANPLFLDTLELVLEILEIVLEILETVLDILGIVLPCTFNFKAKRTYSVKRPGNRVKILQSQTTCPGKGVPQRIPAQSVAVILSIAPGFSSIASSQRKIWKRYAAHSQKPHQEHAGSPTPSSPAKGIRHTHGPSRAGLRKRMEHSDIWAIANGVSPDQSVIIAPNRKMSL